ncbi:hypothetical protein GCM10022222_16410 [Amycolatopsis ultiminotia]|uniref:Uncharacterized protein n=1 Tax=Amycolatopsis ultiminotia TaxID=543629 RepID=A0ABP6VDI4_9PSEU
MVGGEGETELLLDVVQFGRAEARAQGFAQVLLEDTGLLHGEGFGRVDCRHTEKRTDAAPVVARPFPAR